MTTLRLKKIPERFLQKQEEERMRASLLKGTSIIRNKSKNRKEMAQDELQWLYKAYPALFNKKHSKILKINIVDDIIKEHPQKNKTILEMAIQYYMRNTQYLRNLVLSTYRYDLYGQQESLITMKEKDYILRYLEEIEKTLKAEKS